MNDKYEEALESERKKWEFRYNNQSNRIKELEATIKRQKNKIKDLNEGIDVLQSLLKFKKRWGNDGIII